MMRPRRAPLERHDPGRGAVEHRPVVRARTGRSCGSSRDRRPRATRLPSMSSALSGSSSSSVSNRDRRTDLERETLALPARERLDRAFGALGVAAAERGVRAPVEHAPRSRSRRPRPSSRARPRSAAARPRPDGRASSARPWRRGSRPRRTGGSAYARRKSRTVVGRASEPMNCRISPTRPSVWIEPAVGRSSPTIRRSRVDLPMPLAPTRPACSPSGTRNDHPLEQRPAARQGVRDVGELDEPHGRSTLAAEVPPLDEASRPQRAAARSCSSES